LGKLDIKENGQSCFNTNQVDFKFYIDLRGAGQQFYFT